MGWDSGFEYTKKFNPFITYDMFNCIETYLIWKNNDLNFKDLTFENYVNTFYDEDDAENILEVYNNKFLNKDDYFEEICEFYDNFKNENDEFSYSIKNFGTWDAQQYLDGYICSKLKKVNDNIYIGVDKKFIEEAQEWVEQKLEENCLVPAAVNKCFKENADDTITITKCDGLVVDDGETQRLVFTNSEYYDNLYMYVPSAKYNEDEYYCLKNFEQALDKLEILVSDNTNLIWYYRSW